MAGSRYLFRPAALEWLAGALRPDSPATAVRPLRWLVALGLALAGVGLALIIGQG